MVSTTSSPDHAQGVNTSKLDALVCDFMAAERLVEVCPVFRRAHMPHSDPHPRQHCTKVRCSTGHNSEASRPAHASCSFCSQVPHDSCWRRRRSDDAVMS